MIHPQPLGCKNGQSDGGSAGARGVAFAHVGGERGSAGLAAELVHLMSYRRTGLWAEAK
jgi:hypothetical protein